MNQTVVPIVSGGLDSVTMLYHLLDCGMYIPHVVSFNYGQRHKKELDFAEQHSMNIGAKHTVIDLYAAGLTEVLAKSTSSLTNPDVAVPEGHYAEENMKATVVPNRNMIMLAIAGGIAVAENANAIATAVHAGDHFIYPDCREDFINPLNAALARGNQGFGKFPQVIEGCETPRVIFTPFIRMSKADIAVNAITGGVALESTWSCYKGGDIHCGRCGTCVERLEAIDEAYQRLDMANEDRTPYADTEYWREALAKGV